MLSHRCLHTILHKEASVFFYKPNRSIYLTLILRGKSDYADYIILHKMAHYYLQLNPFSHFETVQDMHILRTDIPRVQPQKKF